MGLPSLDVHDAFPCDTLVEKGMLHLVKAVRKITVEVPEDLLSKAQRSTRQGVTATIRRGLELLAARKAYEDLRRLKGRVRFSIDLEQHRADRK